MLIYSNKHYIFSTLTYDNDNSFFVNDRLEDNINQYDGIELHKDGHDYVNLFTFEIEPYEYVAVTKSFSNKYDRRVLKRQFNEDISHYDDPNFDQFYKFGKIKNKHRSDWLFYDHVPYKWNTLPFVIVSDIYAALQHERIFEDKKQYFKKDSYEVLNYQDEGLTKLKNIFPQKDAVYFFWQFSYLKEEHYLEHVYDEDSDFSRNFFICADYVLDDDSYEYFFDFRFHYDGIREWNHLYREEGDSFYRSYLNPNSDEWFYTPLSDFPDRFTAM